MSRRSIQAFSLLEALAMIVTLFVFGWLCVGVAHHDLTNPENELPGKGGPVHSIPEPWPPALTRPTEKPAEKPAEKTPAPATGSQPAGSAAPRKP